MRIAPGPHSAAWNELKAQARRLAEVPTRELFGRDPGRFERFSRTAAGLLIDFSRQHLDETVLGQLLALPEAVDLGGYREAMWRGEKIDVTEGRPVLHVALRQAPGERVGGAALEHEVLEEPPEHHLIEMLARGIDQQSRGAAREALEAPRIALEQLTRRHRGEPARMRVEFGPGGAVRAGGDAHGGGSETVPQAPPA